MNDALKWLSRVITPLGYHIRPRTSPNFLKIRGFEKEDSIESLRKAGQKTILSEPVGNLDEIHIYLRTCLRNDRKTNPKPRLTGDDLAENAYRCIHSLVTSINHMRTAAPDVPIHLVLMDDRSDESYLSKIRAIISTAQIPVTIQQTKVPGQGASLHETFSEGRGKDALVYFVEEDYLHTKDAIFTMYAFYKSMAGSLGTHMVLYPQEHQELYSNHYPSYIVQGADRHWRTMHHATHTFLTHGKIVDTYWPFFENTKYVGIRKKRKLGSENRTTNKLFKKIPGFSPLRPCAIHLQYEELLPPFFDWKTLWDQNEADS